LGSNNEKIEMITNWVVSETKKPVVPKLTALTMDLPSKGLAAKAGGAKGVAAINTISALPGIDIDTFVPFNTVDGMSAYQGLSGKAIKPIALRCVAQLYGATNLPVSATGGAYNWKDAVEFILAGASTIQFCSAVMQHGYGIINDLKSGLLDYMNSKGFETIDDFRGKSLMYITKQIELSRQYKLAAKPDTEKCIGCGMCVTSCADNGYGALRLDGEKAYCDISKCDGCGLCAQVCPKECIDFINR
jgi:dihydropyrimidine dehydrogenase (NAD+) subunit PreA